MRQSLIAALAAGAVLGSGAFMAWNALAPASTTAVVDAHRDLSHATNLSDTDLARALMDRVALTFVASERSGSYAPMSFYTQPLPYGDTLCRVDIVSFPAKIMKGRAGRDDSPFEDNLTVKRAYGVWRSNATGGETRDSACSGYRDFQHLIGGDGLAIERVVNVINKAVASLKAGRANFTVGCGAPGDSVMISCGVTKAAVLRLDPNDFAQAHEQLQTQGKGSQTFVDDLITRSHPDGHGCSNFSHVRIESRQTYGAESSEDPDLVDLTFLPGGPIC